MILPILKEDSPILRLKSEPVEVFDENLKATVDSLLETAKSSHEPAVGLSAIQCGIAKMIILVSTDGKKFTVMINPIILEEKGTQLSRERCLSVRRTCLVERPEKIEYTYQDLSGSVIKEYAKGFKATVVSHECQHLDGVLISDLDLYTK